MMSDFLGSPHLIRFLPSIIPYFGVILNPPPPLKLDIIYERSSSVWKLRFKIYPICMGDVFSENNSVQNKAKIRQIHMGTVHNDVGHF